MNDGICVCRFPDEEAGELPMAFVVSREEHDLTESDVISFVGKMVSTHKRIIQFPATS